MGKKNMKNKNNHTKYSFDQVKHKSFPYDKNDEIKFKPDGLINMLLWDASKVLNIVVVLSLFIWIKWVPGIFTQNVIGYLLFGLFIGGILYGFYRFVQMPLRKQLFENGKYRLDV